MEGRGTARSGTERTVAERNGKDCRGINFITRKGED